jgi:hypothetical protein
MRKSNAAAKNSSAKSKASQTWLDQSTLQAIEQEIQIGNQKITVFARPYRYQGQKPSHYQGIGGSGEFIERELLQVTWKVVSSGFHFQNLSVDDLAFLYENTLVPRERAARSLARTALPSG